MVRQGRVGKRKAAQRQMGRVRGRTWVGQGKARQDEEGQGRRGGEEQRVGKRKESQDSARVHMVRRGKAG